MLVWTIIKVAFKSIAANKLRSFLTMLGVIIGVAAVIAMLGLGAGTKEKVTESVKGMGSNLLVVRPGARWGGGVASADRKDLTLEDAEQVLDGAPIVEMVSPEVNSSYQAKYMNKNTRTSIVGVPPTYFPVRNFEVEHGRAFTDAEVDQAAKVAVLGSKVATDLFGEANPLGEQIKIKGINFLVVGVTKTKGDQGWYNPDDQIIIPLNTARNQVMGKNNKIDSIYLTVKDGADMQAATEEVSAVLRRQHKIQAGQPDDFSVRNLQEIADSLEEVSRVFTLLLSGVASISLLVGGIGIMNIMLVTVTERTREIGIRKALGARNRDLLTQFLLEAVVVSLTGGVLGISFGIGSILLFNYVMKNYYGDQFSAQLQAWPILLAFGFSFAVGVFFGWYPARKAAALDPIDALRYE